MRTGVTASGFAWQLDDAVLNNMELVDALAEMQGDSDILAVSRVLRLLVGDDIRKALYEHLRVDGRVPLAAVQTEITDIFSALGQTGKN